MKALIIGGTGTISTAISKLLLEAGWELYLLNRGNRNSELPEAKQIICNINDEQAAATQLNSMNFDVVADFIAFTQDQVERDYRLFRDKTKQFIYISSASAYQSPPSDYLITEGTTLANPYWEYSRNKIACEEFLIKMYRENGFPITIVRPSHTYSDRALPMGVDGRNGTWQVARRMLAGKPVIIHGDGTSLWTMTHSSDFAKAFVGLMGNIHAIGQAVHITSDETVTWNQIYGIIADALGVELKAVHVSSEFLAASREDLRGGLLGDKAASVVFDNTKIKRLVPGFEATVRLDQGIKQTVDYILSHPECQTEDKEFDEWCDKVIAAVEGAIKSINTK